MNFFYQVKESVIDFTFYKKIKDNRFAKSFLYLLLLFLVIYSMITMRNFILVKTAVEQATFELSESMIEFQLKDGRFSFEGEMPYYISNNTDELFVIDTTGSVDAKILDNVIIGMLITEDKVYMMSNERLQEIDLAMFNQVEFNKQMLIDFMPQISWLVLIVMIAGFVFALGFKLLSAVLLALVGVLINSIYKTDLKYKQLLNFSIYSLTLPMIIKLGVDFSGYIFPTFFVIYWAIAIVYLSVAIRTYRDGINQADGDADNSNLF
ncbi:MAG: DUF1189 domain-containing protein [Lutisporaceae bacterium]